MDDLDHGLVAAILGHEHGIGVRSGCFCAHPYVAHLLGLDASAAANWLDRTRHGDTHHAPGMVRISLGLYNVRSEIDRVVTALKAIAAGDITTTYRFGDHGEYHPTVDRPRRPRPDRRCLVDTVAR